MYVCMYVQYVCIIVDSKIKIVNKIVEPNSGASLLFSFILFCSLLFSFVRGITTGYSTVQYRYYYCKKYTVYINNRLL